MPTQHLQFKKKFKKINLFRLKKEE